MVPCALFCFFFFFNDTATTEIYTLSLHDALPISRVFCAPVWLLRVTILEIRVNRNVGRFNQLANVRDHLVRSEEHTSELQSPCNLVCRLLLEKKKKTKCQKFCNCNEKADIH